MKNLQIEQNGSLRIIRLDRPKALNALSFDMLVALKESLIDALAEESVKTIWIESASPKAFCAGGDVKELVLKLESLSLPIEKNSLGKNYFSLEYSVDLLIEQSPKPIVAYSCGFTFGGGWGLYAGANLRLASEMASFSMPEVQIGFYPDVGAAQFLQHNDKKTGTFVAISGVTLTATEAMALDYVDDIITDDYAQTLKQLLADGLDIPDLDIESITAPVDECYRQWMDALNKLPDQGTLTDWMAIIADNPQIEPFARASQSWLTASSWSIAFSWQYFQLHQSSSRAAVLSADEKVGSYFCSLAEFTEGVSSKLINKGQTASWLYPHVESVPQQAINEALNFQI